MAKDLASLLSKRAGDVLKATVAKIADVYRVEVTATQGHPGYHSDPGEFPFRQTGRGEQNIDWAFKGKGFIAAAGLRPDGEHLWQLKADPPMRRDGSGGPRLAMDDSFFQHLGEIRQAAKDAVK